MGGISPYCHTSWFSGGNIMVKGGMTSIPNIRRTYYDTYANLPTVGLTTGTLGYATDRLGFIGGLVPHGKP